MPIYTYECREHEKFDHTVWGVAVVGIPDSAPCPKCGKSSPRVLTLPAAVIVQNGTGARRGGQLMRDKPDYCDFCDAKTDKLIWYQHGQGAWLCKICDSTPCGNLELYPRQHTNTDMDVLKTIAITTRMIIDAIERKN